MVAVILVKVLHKAIQDKHRKEAILVRHHLTAAIPVRRHHKVAIPATLHQAAMEAMLHHHRLQVKLKQSVHLLSFFEVKHENKVNIATQIRAQQTNTKKTWLIIFNSF